MRISAVRAEERHTLTVEAEDGRKGTFDVTPYLGCEAFSGLRNDDEFRKIRNGKYFIEWDCGADFSADTIEAHWHVTKNGTVLTT